MTSGYGEIFPKNWMEHIYVIIISIVGSFIFAFNLNNIGIILKTINKETNENG